MSKKADEIQAYADRNDLKNFDSAHRTIFGQTSSGSSPLLSADGKTLIKEKILERWAEHFNGVLNRPSAINDEAIARLPQVPTNNSLDDFPNGIEIAKAIRGLASGKAPGWVPRPDQEADRAVWHHVGPRTTATRLQGRLYCTPVQG